MVEQDASPAAVREFFSSRDWRVVSFLGYSGAGYEDTQAMIEQADRILQQLDVEKTVINIGATAEGIGAVYEIAKARGFKTSGIVSSVSKSKAQLSQCVDYVFFVPDESWGGYDKETGKLTPTSEAMLLASNELIAIGGGDIARDELLEAQRLGKKVTFIPADMKHQAARKKAGGRQPIDFRGSAHETMERRRSS
jgi:hypothetical protein